MTRQYIGARYVPIIDGEYNSEKVYEPLTIVTYNGSSYTSKKSVPSGTLPTNTEYWALTGNYSAQVEQYREEVENYSTQVSHYREEVEKLGNAIDINNKSILIIGDSNSDASVVPRNWAVQFKELVEECGGRVTISGISGAALLAAGVGSLSSRYTSLDGASYDYVIIELGVNDWLYNETLGSIDSEFATFMNLVNRSETPPEIYWMLPFKTNDSRGRYLPLDFYRSFYAHVALRYGIRLIDGASAPMVSLLSNFTTKYYRNDGMNIHPNELGSKFIAHFAFKKFLSGGDSGIASYSTNCNLASLVSTITSSVTLTSEGVATLAVDGTFTADSSTINILDLTTPAGDLFRYIPTTMLASIVPVSGTSGIACAAIVKSGNNIQLYLTNYTAGATYSIDAKIPIYLSPYLSDYGAV